jgi:hypothetical protein
VYAHNFISVISTRVMPEHEVCTDCSEDKPQPVDASHYKKGANVQVTAKGVPLLFMDRVPTACAV